MTKKQLKQFVNFWFELYKDCPYTCPPLLFDEYNTLRQDKNPAFEFSEAKYFMAIDDSGKVVGRIAGIINHRANNYWKTKRLRFGWFDFIDDLNVSKALLDAIEEWGKSKGMDNINGPVGFSDMDKEGEKAVDWLKSQNLGEYKVIHIQGVMGSAAQQGRSGALDAKVAAEGNWNIVTQQTAEWNAEKAQQIVQSVIDSGESFNVIYAENDDMAKGAVAALDKAGISHGVGKDVVVMGFDCNKWALQELLDQNWNYDGQCNPFQSSYIVDVIKQLQAGQAPNPKTIIMDEKGFDATTITADDVATYGI